MKNASPTASVPRAPNQECQVGEADHSQPVSDDEDQRPEYRRAGKGDDDVAEPVEHQQPGLLRGALDPIGKPPGRKPEQQAADDQQGDKFQQAVHRPIAHG